MRRTCFSDSRNLRSHILIANGLKEKGVGCHPAEILIKKCDKLYANGQIQREEAEGGFSGRFLHERKVLNDNEWFGCVQWMRKCFKLGTIQEHWKPIQESQWHDPFFEDFINKQIIGYVEKEIR